MEDPAVYTLHPGLRRGPVAYWPPRDMVVFCSDPGQASGTADTFTSWLA